MPVPLKNKCPKCGGETELPNSNCINCDYIEYLRSRPGAKNIPSKPFDNDLSQKVYYLPEQENKLVDETYHESTQAQEVAQAENESDKDHKDEIYYISSLIKLTDQIICQHENSEELKDNSDP
ncbi:unnamed protein product [Diabrotica balteata]|uniref:Uncharacterized protein n=1 Tax=Diabrotica balteata TaxID=107213 RepID=A0A9N9T351_DIABA|nr:unnamed protein product [Diabrotica balteata]